MVYSVYDMRRFYKMRPGRLVRRMINSHLRDLWSDDCEGLRVCGIGFVAPYLSRFAEKAERCFCLMPKVINVNHWPESAQAANLTCLTSSDFLPIETESLDRVVVIHGLEYAEHQDALMQELWRVLKSNGRVIFVVPNRIGLWSRADWTPFGHGSPYTSMQLAELLKSHHFVVENSGKALFMPPVQSFIALRVIYFFEILGKFLFPGLAGVQVIEASKQVFGGVTGHKARANGMRRILVPEGAPSPA